MKKSIKIFVSRRIDQESNIIENPLYINVRCGAALDTNSDSKYLGDNTGENISEKRKSFCELTVHYWAWKNQSADYFGLCHYRRFLSFSSQIYPINNVGVVEYPIIDDGLIDRFHLKEEDIREEVEKYDVITNSLIPVSLSGKYESVYDYCVKNPSGYFEKDIKILFEVINDLYPEDYEIAKHFFAGKENCWYNCFIMRADIFNEYSTWLFNILFELEKRIDTDNYTQEQLRMCGVLGERLWGVYLKKLERQNVKIGYKQLVYIQDANFKKNTIIEVSAECIPIVMPVDANGVSLAATTIRSILDNSNSSQKLKFFILSKERLISENRFLIEFRHDNNVDIEFIQTSYFVNRYKERCGLIDDVVGNMFSVLDICASLDKIIFVCPGMIFKENINKIFQYDIGDAWIGATIDPIILAYAYNTFNVITGYNDTYLCEELNLNKYYYYNSDLLIMKPSKIRDEFSVSAIIDNFNLHRYVQPFSDCVNEVFKNHISEIPMKWNVYFDNSSYLIDWVRWFVPNRIYESFFEAVNEPAVINFLSAFPITDIGTFDKMYELYQYAKRTSFYESLFVQLQTIFIAKPQLPESRVMAIINSIFPLGSRRRMIVRRLVPRDSKRWNFCKRVYHFIKH